MLVTSRPDPTWVYHFTRLEHLSTLVTHGLVSDNRAQREGLLQVEVGNVGIKRRRQEREVPLAPGGVVADYVPFYFAPRSPMMYAIHKGGVESYVEGCDRLIYVVTSTQLLASAGVRFVVSDRNAVLRVAHFTDDDQEVTELIDWPLMQATNWANTEDDTERSERRQAECLVHDHVPWRAVHGIAAKTQHVADEAITILHGLGNTVTRCFVRPRWYF